MLKQDKIEDSELYPSFSCYSSDHSLTSATIAKVIREEQVTAEVARFNELEGADFEFSLMLSDDEDDSRVDWIGFPLFNRDVFVKDELKAKDDENDVSSCIITSSLRKLFIDEREEESSSSCSSSSEADELENLPSGTFCVWKPKAKGDSSPKWKKSSSTGGSGSKKWIGIRYLLRRSNSEGKDPIVLLTPKQKRNSSEVSKVDPRRLKGKTSAVHEQFYVQRRAENEIVKRKTYLPYRQDLFGLFVSSNRLGKM